MSVGGYWRNFSPFLKELFVACSLYQDLSRQLMYNLSIQSATEEDLETWQTPIQSDPSKVKRILRGFSPLGIHYPS